MAESVLEKLAARRPGILPATDAEAEVESADAGGCFGCIRGNPRERAVMLQLRKADGTIKAVPYSWLEEASFHPSDGITLRVGGKKIRITGRNLNHSVAGQPRLFEGLALHRVLWMQEAKASASGLSQNTPSIDQIEW